MTLDPADGDARLDAALSDAVAERRAKVEFRGSGTAVIRVRKPLKAWQHAVFAVVAIAAFAAGFFPVGGLIIIVWALAAAANRERYRLTVDPATGDVTEQLVT